MADVRRYRINLNPLEWNIGEAVGELAAFCAVQKRVPREVRVKAELLKDFQAQLTKQGVRLAWPA